MQRTTHDESSDDKPTVEQQRQDERENRHTHKERRDLQAPQDDQRDAGVQTKPGEADHGVPPNA